MVSIWQGRRIVVYHGSRGAVESERENSLITSVALGLVL